MFELICYMYQLKYWLISKLYGPLFGSDQNPVEDPDAETPVDYEWTVVKLFRDVLGLFTARIVGDGELLEEGEMRQVAELRQVFQLIVVQGECSQRGRGQKPLARLQGRDLVLVDQKYLKQTSFISYYQSKSCQNDSLIHSVKEFT